MKRILPLLTIILSLATAAQAQPKSYKDSIIAFQENYVATHEVVGKEDKQYLSFFAPDESYRIVADFKKINDTKGFDMQTSSGNQSKYFVYGLLTFKIHDTIQKLYVYQSASLMKNEEYFDYLFVPFGDASSGFQSYGGGRYLDFRFNDVKGNQLKMDFNKAYNPYCAYASGYNCPLPPQENFLSVTIEAGEKNYGKPYH